MTDAEKLVEIEKVLEPLYKYCKPGAAVPQNSKTFLELLSALTTIAGLVPDTERTVTVKASEYEALVKFRSERMPPVREK